MGVQVDTTFKICDRDLNKLTLGLNSPGAHYHPLSVNNWSFPAARRRVLERHAWATWISLDSVNPNWIAIFLDSVYDGFWANPSDHDAYWCLIFARHADNAALANSIQRAGARPALPALLESEAERRREVAQAFATGSMRRLMPPSGVAREVFDNADLVHMITRRVVE